MNLLELYFRSLKKHFLDIDSKISINLIYLTYTIKNREISPCEIIFLSVMFLISKKESTQETKFEIVVFLKIFFLF